ncbi:hypothetical protein VTL71DRAFT_4777 [Oculimacula yallundae]|uniref:Uncharacterized protein n=1 Tax=Oculimacula yallundae TaxID=86028 RepID=A0ABR4C5B4_9HELO
MFAKSFLVASFAVLALADPVPAPQVSSIAPDELSSLLDAATSLVGTDYSSLLNDATSVLGALSGIPTLPASIQSILATAVPESELTRTDLQCIVTETPSWYSNLPNNAKSAISSYETALSSWYVENSSRLGELGTDVPAPCPAATAAGGSPTSSASRNGASTTASPSRTGSASPSSASAGSVAATGSSTAAAPRATAMAASIAGLVGMFGVMAAL